MSGITIWVTKLIAGYPSSEVAESYLFTKGLVSLEILLLLFFLMLIGMEVAQIGSQTCTPQIGDYRSLQTKIKKYCTKPRVVPCPRKEKLAGRKPVQAHLVVNEDTSLCHSGSQTL